MTGELLHSGRRKQGGGVAGRRCGESTLLPPRVMPPVTHLKLPGFNSQYSHLLPKQHYQLETQVAIHEPCGRNLLLALTHRKSIFLEHYLLDVLLILKVFSRGTFFILQQGTPCSCAPTESAVLAIFITAGCHNCWCRFLPFS